MLKSPIEGVYGPAELGIVSDVLETLRFRSTIFLRSHLAAPWGFSFGKDPAPRFHISVDGRFFVGEGKGLGTVEVGEMEIVILPSGRDHWIADNPGSLRVPSEKASEACELGSPLFQTGDPSNLVMCGITRFDAGLTHPLLEVLPTLIHFPKFDSESPVWRLVELINAEAQETPSFRSSILDRLTEALFLRLLQEFVSHDEGTLGFIAALRDRPLRRALELIHLNPEMPWTIYELAKRVALSRATLVRRFRESVGAPPIEYLTRWRLLKAHQLVRHSAGSIEQIASRVGFSSAQTLTRAFKRQFGKTPSDLRSVRSARRDP